MSSSASLPYIVKPADLSALLEESSSPRTIPLCGSWFMPNSPHTGRSTFNTQRIPGARFFDIDKCSDTESPYPHMLPSPSHFAQCMTDLEIRRGDRLVVYDAQETGLFSAPRVAWMLRVFGHEKVHVLDNFREWVRLGLETEKGEVKGNNDAAPSEPYPVPEMRKDMIASFHEVQSLVSSQRVGTNPHQIQILDARPNPRFTGSAPEPRPSLSSGHMPGSVSVAFPELLNPATKTLLPRAELRALFEKKGVELGKGRAIISSCGSGVTAAVVDLAVMEAEMDEGMSSEGGSERKVYDGSWT